MKAPFRKYGTDYDASQIDAGDDFYIGNYSVAPIFNQLDNEDFRDSFLSNEDEALISDSGKKIRKTLLKYVFDHIKHRIEY